jgi:phenylacetate-coenzyme A ligase PaaK-like adenylate-forming protein
MDDFDALRRRHIADVRRFTPEAVAHLDWTREQVLENQTHRLREVVAQAQQHSPYLAQRLGHLDASTLQLSDLPSIPPLTKAEVMAHWDQLVTDRRLHLEDVTNHLDQLHSGEHQDFYYLGEYFAAATGGTSGQRGVFLWDWETFVVTANLTYRMEVRQDLKRPPQSPRRTAVICAGSFVHASRMLFPVMLDPQRDVRVISAGTPLDKMVAELNDYQPDRLVGYASIVEELCAEALDGRLKIRLQHISTNSEPLLPEARRMAQLAWGINIHNSWGSVEIGLGAIEGASFAGSTLAEDFLIVESVDAEDRPVADPAQTDRVLVTKLYGHVMPLVRYEMTDIMVIDDGPSPDAPGYRRIVDIKGRTDA